MEIRADILDKLRCAECENYLSSAPVYLKEDGTSFCGRCFQVPKLTNHAVTRNKPYEQLAEMMIFPCPNQQYGCTEKIPFVDLKEHEDCCDFSQQMCPFIHFKNCEWLGQRSALLQHCKKQHPEKILDNPFYLHHDVNQNSLKTFLVSAFNVLFLIHTKVCLQSRKIFHSIRLIGAPERASQYAYDLDVSNGKKKLSKTGIVAPKGCLAIQEDSSVAFSISSLVDFFGDIQNTSFKITVNSKCEKCKETVDSLIYRTKQGWHCPKCAPPKKYCRNSNRGCVYFDVKEKTKKHESIYCWYGTLCWICAEDVVCGTRDSHYKKTHIRLTFPIEASWPALVTNVYKWYIVTTDIGNIVCRHILNATGYKFAVHSPLISKWLHKYYCRVLLKNPATGHSIHKILNVCYEQKPDWILEIKRLDFLPVVHNEQFIIKLELVKNSNT